MIRRAGEVALVRGAPSPSDAAAVAVGGDLHILPRRAPLGQWLGGSAALVVVGALVLGVARSPAIDWGVVRSYVTADVVLDGVRLTILLTAAAMIFGIAFGVVLAAMRLSANRVLRAIAWAYVWIFRGTPELVQIILLFNLALVFPSLGFGSFSVPTNQVITPFMAALLGLGLNEAAYMSEIVRGSLLGVDAGQREAAAALGMTGDQTLRHITLPQAVRTMLPPTVSEVTSMLKTTSLVSVIGAADLLTQVSSVYARTFQVVDLLVVASIWYLAMTTVISGVQLGVERLLERRAGR